MTTDVTRDFSKTFDHMCNFVAVYKTGDPETTLKGLVEICFVILPDRTFEKAYDFIEPLEVFFGLTLSGGILDVAVNALLNQQRLSYSGNVLRLRPDIRTDIESRIAESRKTEDTVKDSWLSELEIGFPQLPPEEMWKTLRLYLERAFRRHGLQTIALLDTTQTTPSYYDESLSRLLIETVRDTLDRTLSVPARKAISDFLAQVGKDSHRTRYITQLADGAFSFYSLSIPQEVARQFASRLQPLTLFLDTNFLFGILDLNSGPYVQVSQQLVNSITRLKLPFTLRYHEATKRELFNTYGYYSEQLRSRNWSQGLSRAAVKSRGLSGIELKYHEINGRIPLDVKQFLEPYTHLDVLLKDKGIDVFSPSVDRLQERTDLCCMYTEYLADHGKEKAHDTVFHDATVLDAVQLKRSRSKSTLEAGAILVTCDYWLFRFDWEALHQKGQLASVVLPSNLWQILRPYMPSDADYERAFAETFALPEFRSVGSNGSRACSRMLQIMASYQNVSEETAENMLSNRLLLEQLEESKNDGEFQQTVENAFVEANAALMEEKAALVQEKATLARQLAEERQARNSEALKRQEEERENHEKASNLEKEIAALKKDLQKTRDQVEQETDQLTQTQQTNEQLNITVRATSKEIATIRRHKDVLATFLATVLSVITVFALLGLSQYLQWQWFTLHPRQVALTACFWVLSLCGFGFALIDYVRRHWIPFLLTIIGATVCALLSCL